MHRKIGDNQGGGGEGETVAENQMCDQTLTPGGWRDGSAVKNLHCPSGGPEFSSQDPYWTASICTSSSSGSDVFFRPSQAQAPVCAHTHKHTRMHMTKSRSAKDLSNTHTHTQILST